MSTLQRFFAGLPLVLLCLGCAESSTAPKTIPVTGKITFHGGDWPKTAKVSFVMTQPAEGSPMQSGSADIKPDGTFKASTFDVGDGLVPGTYQIAFEAWETEPALSQGPPQSLVPAKFQKPSQSGLMLEVPKDAKKPVEFNFDIPVL